MTFRKIVSACAAAALLASAPVAAQAAAPLSLANSPSVRAGAPVDEENSLRGRHGTLIMVGVVAAVVLILWLTETWPFDGDDSNDSDSP